MFDYHGRVVVVSGASSGLGTQMAHGFAGQGADLVITARRIEKLEGIAKEIREKYGVKVLCVKCDVTDVDSITAAAEATIKEYGKVDVLVNCAGNAKNNNCLDMTDEEWKFTIDTDLSSVFYVTRAFGKYMKEAGYGRIINIASMYGLVGNNLIDTTAYHASKGGVVNMTRAVAAELAKYNITCNAICPGYFWTELTASTLDTDWFKEYAQRTTPLGRYGKAGELNSAAIFLGAEESSFVTGVCLPVDGGYTCI